MQECFRDAVLRFFYPERCPVCDRALAWGQTGICGRCLLQLEYIREPKCFRCGKPLSEEDTEFCRSCQEKSASYERGHALLLYDGRMQESIARLKYGGRREYAGVYGEELYRRYGTWIGQIGAEALVPVPIHRTRLRSRGFNQAKLIADRLGMLTGLPVREDLVLRIRQTAPQKALSARERRKNLEGAFQPGRAELNPVPECVIIVDDIYTTGSTMESCAVVLREMGARKIYFLCVCIGKDS